MGKIKELGKLIVFFVISITLIYVVFGGLHLLKNYLDEEEVKDSEFCEKMNMSYYMIVNNGFASAKIICLDVDNNRREYYYEEIYN